MIDVWPTAVHFGQETFNPEDLFSALVNHFKMDNMEIYVYADPDKFDNADYNIPEEYSLPFYRYTVNMEDFDEDEIADGTIRIGLDGDNAYVYDENYDEIAVNDIEDADWVQFY